MIGRTSQTVTLRSYSIGADTGPTWLLTELWESLGFGALLRQALRRGRRHFDAEAVVRLMVFNRLCDPSSKLGVLRWLEGVVVPGVETGRLTHQHLLRAMDALMRHREPIRKALCRCLLPLIDRELSVVFYDLTPLRVHGEGEVEGELRAWGRSKELEGHPARQVVLGLVQTADGLPLDFEVFEGNVAEVSTLVPVLERCRSSYAIDRMVVVADRGLLSLDNVEQIERLGLEYILAVPAGRYRDFAGLLGQLVFEPEGESVRETQWQGRRLVVAHSPEQARLQGERRQEKLDELIAFGEKLAGKLDAQEAGQSERGRRASDRGAYSRFCRAVHEAHFSRFITPELESERFSFTVHEQAIERASWLDGKLVLLSNVGALPKEEIVSRYKALADIERGFRVLKRDLEIAPMYHYKPERIRAHVLLCFLALVLHRVMRMRLKAHDSPFSVERALEKLRGIQLHQVEIGHKRWRGLTKMTPEQLKLFETLEVKAPSAEAM